MANQFIPYGRQHITDADIEAVVSVLKSDFLTQGSQVPAFEELVSTYTGASYGVAVNSATSALHIACLALGLGKGDWLWTTPNTFVASSNCALYCGATVDFVDIDPVTLNMSVEKLAEKLQLAKANHTLPKIVIPVHFAGEPCDMAAIYALSQQYGFKIIEDASHAIGGSYQQKPIGSCQYSDITVFSFHPVKIITTAEGGLATTNDPVLAEKMQLLRSHGITRDANLMTQEPDGDWYYQQIDLGFNYRITDMQAALGKSQMDRLDEFVDRRRILAKQYDELLKDIKVITPYQDANTKSSWHLYVIKIDFQNINISKKELFKLMKEKGIILNLHYIPVHTQPYYKNLGFEKGDFPVSEQYYKEVFTLPLYYSLTDEQQDYIVTSLKEVLKS